MAKTGASTTALTRDAKAMIQMAFDDLGGLPRLVEWANNPANLSQFYTQIWSKIIPKDIKSEMSGKDGGPVKMSISWMSEIEDAAVIKEIDTDDEE